MSSEALGKAIGDALRAQFDFPVYEYPPREPMKLYRIIRGLDSILAVAPNADAALQLAGVDTSWEDYSLLEYPLDEAYLLPAEWEHDPMIQRARQIRTVAEHLRSQPESE